jgi:hypothetical protein
MDKRTDAEIEWRTDKALKKRACMIAHRPTKTADCPYPGWWVREYHSTVAMANHLKGKKGSYVESGPFRTEEEARAYAMGWA